MRDLDEDFAHLRTATKVSHNFFHNHSKNIIQLDETYYNTFNRGNPLKISFNLYIIQEIEQYLFEDKVTDQNRQRSALLRSELISLFG